MKDEEWITKKPQSKAQWKQILAGFLPFGIMIGAHEFLFDPQIACHSLRTSYSALHFAIASFGFAFFFLTQSFIPQSISAVAEVYPDANGNAEWHARSSYRLGAMSNIGYALVMLACAWMWPDGSGEVWYLFPAMFGIGLTILVSCKTVLWIRHAPYRDIMVQAYALKAVMFIFAILSILIYWAYRPFYFDPIMAILIYTLCSVLADLLVGIRHQINFKRSNSVLSQ